MSNNNFIYLDYQATTPVDQEVVDAMIPCFTQSFGNPSSSHFLGIEALQMIEDIKTQIAHFLNAKPHEIFFTSGSTEGNNLALKGIIHRQKLPSHIITVSTEHKSILDVCSRLEQEGCQVTYIQPDSQGLINLEELKKAIKSNTVLISVMYGNNEIGTIQDIKEIGKISKESGIYFHCDATQGLAYDQIDVNELGIDILTFSSHKIYGPKGVGVIFIKNTLIENKIIQSEIEGGHQQRNLRSGTFNVPGIVGLGKAVQLVQRYRETDRSRVSFLRNLLLEKLRIETNCILNGHPHFRLPNNLNVSFSGIDGQKFMEMVSSRLAISNGSACNSGSQQPSYVLQAIGLPTSLIQSTFRLSLGRPTTKDEVIEAAEVISSAYQKLYKANHQMIKNSMG